MTHHSKCSIKKSNSDTLLFEFAFDGDPSIAIQSVASETRASTVRFEHEVSQAVAQTHENVVAKGIQQNNDLLLLRRCWTLCKFAAVKYCEKMTHYN